MTSEEIKVAVFMMALIIATMFWHVQAKKMARKIDAYRREEERDSE